MAHIHSFDRDRQLATIGILSASVLLAMGSILALADIPYVPLRFGLVVAAAVLIFGTLGWIIHRHKGRNVREVRMLLVALTLFAISLAMQPSVVTVLIRKVTTLDERQQLYGIQDPLSEIGLGLVILFATLLYIKASQRSHELTIHINQLRESEQRLTRERCRADEAESEIEQLRANLQHAGRLSVMGEMAAGIAHELNQPLGAIANFASGCKIRLRQPSTDNDEVLDTLEQISSESLRAATIIKRIREFVGRRLPQIQAIDANGSISDAIQLTKSRLQRECVQLLENLGDDLPKVSGDHTQITQVVSNLIMNAVDAMCEREPERRVLEITSRYTNNGKVEIGVCDTGSGVPADMRECLFNQFSTTKNSGLGIGLSISRSIVEAHGGEIWFTSNEAEGTTFWFTLMAEAEPIVDPGCA